MGGSEKAIAAAFRRAASENAVLMLDEVDSFLRTRESARHDWETTQVNEMLTQMENFNGIFIASTNLVEHLDPAALRRFDVKIRLSYLQAAQALRLLERTCAALGLDQPEPEHVSRINGLSTLIPGDFAAVSRRHRFAPLASCTELLTALEQECAIKPGRPAPIGFLS